MMMTSRLSRCHQTPRLVAANVSFQASPVCLRYGARVKLHPPVRNYADDRHLDATKQLLAFFEGKPDLLRRQIGNRSRDRADVASGGPIVVVQSDLYPNRPFHGIPSFEKQGPILCQRPHIRSTSLISAQTMLKGVPIYSRRNNDTAGCRLGAGPGRRLPWSGS